MTEEKTIQYIVYLFPELKGFFDLVKERDELQERNNELSQRLIDFQIAKDEPFHVVSEIFDEVQEKHHISFDNTFTLIVYDIIRMARKGMVEDKSNTE